MLCGIDEAGRGPLAGSLVMAGVVLHRNIAGLNDSKKLTSKQREALFARIVEASTYHIVSFSAGTIDTHGMSHCLREGLLDIMAAISCEHYLFDGNSNFGVTGLATQIKADATVAAVSAASIMAKVTRDREMLALARQYPDYGFERHKGYGTALHIQKIQEHGYCDIHRRSFHLKALKATLF